MVKGWCNNNHHNNHNRCQDCGDLLIYMVGILVEGMVVGVQWRTNQDQSQDNNLRFHNLRGDQAWRDNNHAHNHNQDTTQDKDWVRRP